MDLLVNERFLRYYNQDLIAKSGIKTLYDVSLHSDQKEMFKKLFESRDLLIQQNPENIVLRNSIDFCLYKLNTHRVKKELKDKNHHILKKIEQLNSDVASVGAKKIRPGSAVFVHSINNHVLGILKHAGRYKEFSLNLVEHHPLKFGNALKKKLSSKVSVNIYPDLALKDAVQNSDICLVGAEAVLKNTGAVAKMGSHMSCAAAKEKNIPVYLCAHSLKYDHKHNMLDVLNMQLESGHDISRVYEYLSSELIHAYVLEFGIIKPNHMLSELRIHNRWLFV